MLNTVEFLLELELLEVRWRFGSCRIIQPVVCRIIQPVLSRNVWKQYQESSKMIEMDERNSSD